MTWAFSSNSQKYTIYLLSIKLINNSMLIWKVSKLGLADRDADRQPPIPK
jgi:hypothetical protein